MKRFCIIQLFSKN